VAQNETTQGKGKTGAQTEPEPDPEPVVEEDRFSRERVLGDDGPALTGVDPWIIAGALAKSSAKSFTRDELKDLVEDFHAHEEKK